jgi:hypothetical protein
MSLLSRQLAQIERPKQGEPPIRNKGFPALKIEILLPLPLFSRDRVQVIIKERYEACPGSLILQYLFFDVYDKRIYSQYFGKYEIEDIISSVVLRQGMQIALDDGKDLSEYTGNEFHVAVEPNSPLFFVSLRAFQIQIPPVINCSVFEAALGPSVAEPNRLKKISRYLFSLIDQGDFTTFREECDIPTVDLTRIKDVNGRRLLHAAVERGSRLFAEHLLSRGCNVNAQSKDGSTALHIACRRQDAEMIELLVSYGASKQIDDNDHKRCSEFL